MSVILAVDNLCIAADHGPLVQDVSFAVERGQCFTILGETGSGKSLVSQTIMGTLTPSLRATGLIAVDGAPSAAASDERRPLWGRTLALLPQEPWLSLDPTMKTIDQVAEGYRGAPRGIARHRARESLHGLGLRGAEDHYPFMLSGGMAQRVSFAATTAAGASIILVDEPTKGLDVAMRGEVIAVLKRVLAQGGTLVTITHDVEVARALGGQVAVMLDGVIVEQGPADLMLSAPRHPYTRRLLAAEPAAWPARMPARLGASILSARNLTKRYGARTLFEEVDLDVRAGERLAIVGPSGSGKTTFGDVLLGLTRPDRGTVARAPHLGPTAFQKLYQNPPAAFPPHATLRRTLDDLVRLHRLDPGEIPPLMARLRLNPILLDRRPDQVSGGELQRFALLRILLLSPAFIFADEPTSRLDPITQQEVMDLLVEHSAERGFALLLVTHDEQLGLNVADGKLFNLNDRSSSDA